MAKTVDSANANAAARDICSRLYVPLSHFTGTCRQAAYRTR